MLFLSKNLIAVPSQAPIRFTVTADTSTSITTTWQLPPADSRNGIIRGFKLFYREEDTADSQITTLAINDSTTYSRTVSGLLRYTKYEFQVLAFTSVGDGPKSAAKVERTKEDGKGLERRKSDRKDRIPFPFR